MIVHNYGKIPPDSPHYGGEITELYECQLDDLESQNIDEIWYWYAWVSYEGFGELIARKGERYDRFDLGHCSCYGPTDHISFGENSGFNSVDELKNACSEDCLKNIGVLVDMVKQDYREEK